MQAEAKLGTLRAAAEMHDQREKDVVKLGVDVLKQMSSQAHQKEMQRRTPTKGKQ